MSRIIDLSPPVPQGFMGPPSTNIGVQFEVRTKRSGSSYWQSGQAFMSLHTGCHVESALHCFEDGEPIDQVGLERVIGSAVVLDLTPVAERALIDVADLERAYKRLVVQHETIKAGDIILLRLRTVRTRKRDSGPWVSDAPGKTGIPAPGEIGESFSRSPAR